VSTGARTMDYRFTLIEMRMPRVARAREGLAQAAIAYKNGNLQLDNYGQQPVRLTTISDKTKKKK